MSRPKGSKNKVSRQMYPALVAGKVDPQAKAVIKTVMNRIEGSEGEVLRRLIALDRSTVMLFKEAWREVRAA